MTKRRRQNAFETKHGPDKKHKREVENYTPDNAYSYNYSLVDTVSAKDAMMQLSEICNMFPVSKNCRGQFSAEQWIPYLIRHSTSAIFSHVATATAMHISVSLSKTDRYNAELLQGPSEVKLNELLSDSDIIVVPIIIHMVDTSTHANMIIINRVLKTVEHFESNGNFDFEENRQNTFAKQVKCISLFVSDWTAGLAKLPGFRYVDPYLLCPIVAAPQKANSLMEKDECGSKTSGFCLIYSTIYAHLRILCIRQPAHVIMEQMLLQTDQNMLRMVRQYDSWQRHSHLQDELVANVGHKFDSLLQQYQMSHFISTTGLLRQLKEYDNNWTSMFERSVVLAFQRIGE
jgi:hypothetical protein